MNVDKKQIAAVALVGLLIMLIMFSIFRHPDDEVFEVCVWQGLVTEKERTTNTYDETLTELFFNDYTWVHIGEKETILEFHYSQKDIQPSRDLTDCLHSAYHKLVLFNKG